MPNYLVGTSLKITAYLRSDFIYSLDGLGFLILTLSIQWRSRRPPIVDTPSDAGGRSDRLIPTVQVMCQYAAIGITKYATRVFVAIDGQ